MCIVAEPLCLKLVAEGEQTRRLQTNDRNAPLDRGLEHRKCAHRFGARFVDHACREKRSAATRWTIAVCARRVNQVSRRFEHASRGNRVFWLEVIGEGVDEQHDIARCGIGRASGRQLSERGQRGAVVEGTRRRHRQRTPRCHSGDAFAEARQSVRSIAERCRPAEEPARQGRCQRVRQLRDHLIAPRDAVTQSMLVVDFDFHLRHVDAGRALAPAPLARYAERQRIPHRLRCQRIGAKLPRNRQPQRIRPAARYVLFVTRRAIARTHRARIELAAVAVVVAHLDGLGEPLCGVAAGARRAQRFGRRVVVHVPVAPVECRCDRDHAIPGRIAIQRAVGLPRRLDDLPGIHQAARIEQRLDLGKRLRDARTEERRDPFAADETVAVLARIGALVFTNELGGFLGDRAHLDRSFRLTHVEDRTNMQGADRCMRIPRPFGAVAREDFGQPPRVLGEMLEGHRAVLDERHRLAVALHAHHDIEAGLAHVPQRFLRGGIGHRDDAARQSEIAHQVVQPFQLCEKLRAIIASEFHQQDRFRLSTADGLERAVDHRTERRIRAREIDHRPVDQLDGDRIERHDVLRRLHRCVERREVDDAENARRWQR